MSTPHEPDVDVLRRFRRARGELSDAEWASIASEQLVAHGVRPESAKNALLDVAHQVAEARESPSVLFGDPRAWGRQREAEWADDGEAYVSAPHTTVPRNIFLAAGAMGAGLIVVWMIVEMIRFGGEVRVRPFHTAFVAVGIGLGVAGAVPLYRWIGSRRARRGRTIPMLLTMLCLAALAGYVVLMVFLTQDSAAIPASPWWYLALAAVLAGVVCVSAHAWPPRAGIERPHGAGGEWTERLAEHLRARGDLSSGRIRDIVAEARTHAADAGVPAREEFGEPEEYSATFPYDAPAAHRRVAAGLLSVAAFLALLGAAEWIAGTWDFGAISLTGWAVIIACWAIVRLVRAARAQ